MYSFVDLYCSLPKYGSFSSLQRQKSVDVSSISTLPKAVDVFISYRRSTGSQLARYNRPTIVRLRDLSRHILAKPY